MTRSSEATLVAAIRGGDRGLFAEVVRRFEGLVRRIAARVVRDPDGRDEVVQQTFLRAFRRLDTLADGGRLKPWLATIARNCAADHLRRRPREDRALPDTAAPPGPPRWIWEEVDALPPELSVVLRLRYLDRLTYAGIAQRLGVPASTVRGRIFLARRALRRRLEDPQ